MDLQSVGKATSGETQLLGLIDMFSQKVHLSALTSRQAEPIAEAILESVCFTQGIPLRIHSDEPAEFTGAVVSKMSETLGIIRTGTMGYHPQGNAMIERFWQYANRCFRLMSEDEYKKWPCHLRRMEFAWNTTLKSTTGVTPFEIDHGAPARTLPAAIGSDRHAQESSAARIPLSEIIRATQGSIVLISKF